MKRILLATICLSLIAALILTGCSGSDTSELEITPLPQPMEASAVPGDAVVASIGDRSILRKELQSEYNAMIYMYTYYGYSVPTADADIETYQDYVLSDLVGNMLLMHQADLMGITPLSEDEEAEISAQLESDKQEQLDIYREYAEEEGAEDPDSRAIEMINEELDSYGWGMDYNEYWQYQYDYLLSNRVLALLEEEVRSSVTASEEDAKAYYDELLEKDTTAYSGENRAAYLSAREAYDMHGGDPIVYVPDGYMRIKVLSLVPEGAADPQLIEYENAAAELESEYGRLALRGGNEDRMKEIQAQYASVYEKAAAMRSEYMQSVQAEAEEIERRLAEGEDFDDLLLEFDDTEDYKTYPVLAGKGRLLFADGEDGWSEAVRSEAMSLEEGTYSGVIEDGLTLCFVYLVGPEPEGAVPFEEVQEAMYEKAAAAQKDAAWSKAYESWYSDDSEVVYHEENYRDIGK